MALYPILHRTLPPLARGLWRPQISGVEHLPRHGGVIIAANHRSFIDSVLLPIAAPRPVAFLAKSDYFDGSGLKGALNRAWFEALGMLPVDRDDAGAALASLDVALGVLRDGGAFGIYPEGTRSRDGRLYRGRTGVAHLALTSGAPIVPVGLIGTERLLPIDARVPRLVRVQVRFGAPILSGDRFADLSPGRARRRLTDEVMTAIATLSGQEPVAAYNDRSG